MDLFFYWPTTVLKIQGDIQNLLTGNSRDEAYLWSHAPHPQIPMEEINQFGKKSKYSKDPDTSHIKYCLYFYFCYYFRSSLYNSYLRIRYGRINLTFQNDG